MGQQEQGGSQDTGVSTALAEEIGSGVDAAMAEIRQGDGEAVPEGEGKAGDKPDEENTEEAGDAEVAASEEEDSEDAHAQEPSPASLSEDLLERAVKAGLSLSEAKEYPSERLLSAMCGRLEAGRGSQDDAGKGEGAQANSQEEDPFAALPDLDPDEYAEPLVAGFKTMKEMLQTQNKQLQAQNKELQELRSQGSESWLDGQVKEVRSVTKGDNAKEKALRSKFAALEAGYKAVDQEVSRESVFEEAKSLVLGDDLRAAKEASQGKAAEKRSRQQIQRASGNTAKSKGNVVDDTAAELDKQFFS